MCGTFGVHLRGDPDELRSMLAGLRHRGPDDEGVYTDGRAGVGHTRLSIVDLAGGHQPTATDLGHPCIPFNGEIHDHAALRGELGGAFRARSDTEVILRLYERDGSEAVARLDAMFAFAILALRHTFEDLLPASVAWRAKEKLSRGCGDADVLAGVAEAEIGDEAFEAERTIPPCDKWTCKEELLYYRVFQTCFGKAPAPLAGRSHSL